MKLKQLYPLLTERVKKPIMEQSPPDDSADPFEPIPYEDEHMMTPGERAYIHAEARKKAAQAIIYTLSKRKDYWDRATRPSGRRAQGYNTSALDYTGTGGVPAGNVQWGKYHFDPADIENPEYLRFLMASRTQMTNAEALSKKMTSEMAKYKRVAKKEKEAAQTAALATNPVLNSPSTGTIPVNQIPAKVKTGPKSKGVDNPYFHVKPAKGGNPSYAGDPKGCPFSTAMKKLYLEIATALARHGKVLSVVYQGPYELIATTADGKFAWRKWGMNNKVFMNSEAINTSEFIGWSPTRQDAEMKKNKVV